MNSPKTVRDTCWTRPAPPQDGHVAASVPGSAPLPPHVPHPTVTGNGTSRLVPVAASTSSISTSATTSAPRAR
jgi:hypothetical protein